MRRAFSSGKKEKHDYTCYTPVRHSGNGFHVRAFTMMKPSINLRFT